MNHKVVVVAVKMNLKMKVVVMEIIVTMKHIMMVVEEYYHQSMTHQNEEIQNEKDVGHQVHLLLLQRRK